METSIVWFKTDLRLHDNETLIRAIENSEEIIPVYCFDESHFKTSQFGFKKTGNFRVQFLIESLIDLDLNLRKFGSGLLIVNGKPEIELFKIAELYKVKKIYAKEETAFEEKQTENKVEIALNKLNIKLETFSSSTLYAEKDLPFQIKDLPVIFTEFRKRLEKSFKISATFPTPITIKSPLILPIKLPTLNELDLNDVIKDTRAVIDYKGGETAGLERVNYYFFQTKSVSNYKITRNGLIGGDFSTKFSAWLAMGCLSAKEIYYKLKEYETQFGANESTYWVIFELLWRDYFRFIMQKFGYKSFLKGGIKDNQTRLKGINHNSGQLLRWVNGQTGVDFIDANMIELKLTGFMSNRGRQNVASYLCNNLQLDWRYGAAYFEQQLIDYDVNSNWGNWAYIAGAGSDPRPNRYFNIEKQAADYDINKLYRNLWLSKI